MCLLCALLGPVMRAFQFYSQILVGPLRSVWSDLTGTDDLKEPSTRYDKPSSSLLPKWFNPSQRLPQACGDWSISTYSRPSLGYPSSISFCRPNNAYPFTLLTGERYKASYLRTHHNNSNGNQCWDMTCSSPGRKLLGRRIYCENQVSF